jgi:hypothetical protein
MRHRAQDYKYLIFMDIGWRFFCRLDALGMGCKLLLCHPEGGILAQPAASFVVILNRKR